MLRETTSRGLCGLVCPSLVPLVWESNPKLQGGWYKPNHQPSRDLEPTQAGLWRRLVVVAPSVAASVAANTDPHWYTSLL